ncbi:glycosyltransferase family 2 protein [Candidatus Omnitrophota bacterium]
MAAKVPLTCVVITKNEEANIEGCLKSVHGWADEIIVVDDESSDRTEKIAQSYADKVFCRRMEVEGRHRNWAYAQASNDWVLSLDADERVTPELREEISQAIGKGAEFAGFSIPRRNLLGNYWLKWGGQYPAAQLKLFQKDRFRWEEVQVHPRAFLDGKSGRLKSDIIHYSWRDFAHFFDKVNSQSTLEARKWVHTKRRMSMAHAFWRAADRFFRKFIRKKGYKDGFYGFIAAFSDSIYQIQSYAKYWEMHRRSKENHNG